MWQIDLSSHGLSAVINFCMTELIAALSQNFAACILKRKLANLSVLGDPCPSPGRGL